MKSNILRVIGAGCWIRKLKNPKPKTHNPKPDLTERLL
jgi:hypothetical protein